MARLAPVRPGRGRWGLKILYAYLRRRFGAVPEPVAGYAHNPRVLAALGATEALLERARAVDPRLKMLAELRVAARVGCPFGLDIGSGLARDLGIGEAQLRDLNRYETSAAFSDVERRVLAFADGMTATPTAVPDALFESLRAHFDAAQLVELAAAVAHENLRARLNHALGYKAQGFSGAGYCVLAA